MIVSASRRTDIPAFYAEWFRQRLRAGFCVVSNPFNPKQISRVSLRREDVSAFFFWTRNPLPFLPVLDELEDGGFPSVVLITLTGYGPPLEPYAPALPQGIDTFRQLSGRLGAARVVWRYDPIVLGPGLAASDHVERFRTLAIRLAGATETVKLSLVDLYRKTRRRLGRLPNGDAYTVDPAASAEIEELIRSLAAIACEHGMRLETCAEERDYSLLGARPGSCIDSLLLRRLLGGSFPISKDPGQRRHCRCVPSKDIGMNDCCLHGCTYCYATRSHELAVRNHARHDPTSPSLLSL